MTNKILENKQKIVWFSDPFPYAIIDNFLTPDEFQALKNELNNQKNILQRDFQTPLENKSIYQFNACGKFASSARLFHHL